MLRHHLQIPSAASTAALCQPGSWGGTLECRPVQKPNLGLSDSTAKLKPAKASMGWDNPLVEDFPPLFDQLLDSEDEYRGGEAEEDHNLDLLNDKNKEDDEDGILPPTQTS